GGLLSVIIGAKITAIHVDGYERFGLLNDDGTAVGQRDFPHVDLGDLFLQTVLVKERFHLIIVLDAVCIAWHDELEELSGLLKGSWFIDPDRIDIARE